MMSRNSNSTIRAQTFCYAPGILILSILSLTLTYAQTETIEKPGTAGQNTIVTEPERKLLLAALEALKPEDIPKLTRDAEAGDNKSQWMLGGAYADGKVVPKDSGKYWSWIQKSAANGWPVGQSAVGIAYMKGEGVDRNPIEGVNWFRKAADQGYAQAQARLGTAYYLGIGVPRDPKEAVVWFRKATDQENPLGQFWLGNAYTEGEGTEKDVAQAVNWFRKAAEQGDAAAEYQLGRLYDNGQGASQDHAEGARWYKKAAEHDLPIAQFDLAIDYHNGIGVPKNKDEAEKWFRKASDAGWAPATYYLGRMYSDRNFQTSPQSGETAVKLFEKSAEQGYVMGAFVLSDIYSNRFLAYHLWISRDEARACHWLLVARELSKNDRWRADMPDDSARAKAEVQKQVPKFKKNLKAGFASCEQSALDWVKAHPASSLP